MCWSAIASPGTSPCVAADAAPSATVPIAAPMAAAIPRDIIRHLHLRSGCSRVRPLWYGHRSYKFGKAAKETAAERVEVSYLCLEVDPIVRQDSHHGSVFTQLSKKPTSGIDCCDATHSRGLVSIYGLVVPTSAARRSATLLILSRRGAIFDRSERLRSSKYEAKPTISFTMSSTVCGFRPGIPNGHSSSSFALAVSSYRPSSRFFRSSSWVIWSKSG